ncbi:acyl-CoA synthetase FdrA [Neisseriaceae bacterium TC5R-5]|nr:acyl-CoA synthetase FdrA [Neisseriaceae bacterium TC5R-5]
MKLYCKTYPNLYKDSVSLMQISASLNGVAGVSQASVAMATEANIARMHDAGMAVAVAVKPNDLLIALLAGEASAEEALALADSLLKPSQDSAGEQREQRAASSIAQGVERMPAANMALISVPGSYAAAETMKALRLGLNVMLFSDNVSEENEISLKNYASQQDLLVMGPDCGTAIVNGLPLGFANVVRRGAIGLVAASGTGLQEVSCRIHHLGEGVSQALGTGGRDLHEGIDGQSMCQALKMLAADADTKLIVLISKPPAASVANKVLRLAASCGKPVVVHFLGAKPESLREYAVTASSSLQHAADTAVALLRHQPLPVAVVPDAALLAQAQAKAQGMEASQTQLRAIFAGGTFCYEAQLALLQQGLCCESNAPVQGAQPLRDPAHCHGHSLLDMGDDEFTQGRPHPMIDPTLRNARLLQEAAAAETAVLLFDVVLGYGASMDPVAELLQVLAKANAEAARQQRQLLYIAHVCGTELDPQSRQQQVQALQQAGVIVADSNVQAAQLAAQIIQSRQGSR